MTPLSKAPADWEKLAKIAGMLGSTHEGERAAAALKATALLDSHGLTWSALLANLTIDRPRRYLTRPETRRTAAKMAVRS